MKKQVFPWIALSLGLLLMVALLGSGALRPPDEHGLPLLTMLIVAEFGFFLTAIGAWIGSSVLSKQGIRISLLITTLACGLLAVGFLFLGLRLWPGGFPAL
jgi:hypothetical protein